MKILPSGSEMTVGASFRTRQTPVSFENDEAMFILSLSISREIPLLPIWQKMFDRFFLFQRVVLPFHRDAALG